MAHSLQHVTLVGSGPAEGCRGLFQGLGFPGLEKRAAKNRPPLVNVSSTVNRVLLPCKSERSVGHRYRFAIEAERGLGGANGYAPARPAPGLAVTRAASPDVAVNTNSPLFPPTLVMGRPRAEPHDDDARVIGRRTIYRGTEHPYLIGATVVVVAVLKAQPRGDRLHLGTESEVAAAGGVGPDDRLDVAPWLPGTGRLVVRHQRRARRRPGRVRALTNTPSLARSVGVLQ